MPLKTKQARRTITITISFTRTLQWLETIINNLDVALKFGRRFTLKMEKQIYLVDPVIDPIHPSLHRKPALSNLQHELHLASIPYRDPPNTPLKTKTRIKNKIASTSDTIRDYCLVWKTRTIGCNVNKIDMDTLHDDSQSKKETNVDKESNDTKSIEEDPSDIYDAKINSNMADELDQELSAFKSHLNDVLKNEKSFNSLKGNSQKQKLKQVTEEINNAKESFENEKTDKLNNGDEDVASAAESDHDKESGCTEEHKDMQKEEVEDEIGENNDNLDSN